MTRPDAARPVLSHKPILQVVVDARLRQTLDYLVPEGGTRVPIAGMRVAVPLGRRRAVGYVAGLADTSSLPPSRLKAIYEVLDDEPLWDQATFGLLRGRDCR